MFAYHLHHNEGKDVLLNLPFLVLSIYYKHQGNSLLSNNQQFHQSLLLYFLVNLGLDKNGDFIDSIVTANGKRFEGVNHWRQQRKAREVFSKAIRDIDLSRLNPNQQRSLVDSLYPLGVGGSNWNKRISILKDMNDTNMEDSINEIKKLLPLKQNQESRNRYRIKSFNMPYETNT